MALSGKELDDSIFATDLDLDWAEEADTIQTLSAERILAPYTPAARTVEASRPAPRHTDRRDTRDARPSNHTRQPRNDSRARPSQDANNRGRGERPDRGTRVRGNRSTSRSSGYNAQPFANPSADIRRPRDRSTSTERPGSIDRSRAWRGPSRADRVDRWDHDKFEHSAQPPAAARAALDVEHIGKEGVSHVTINRRGSNASARSYPAASFDTPRRLGPDHAFEERSANRMPHAAVSPRSPGISAANEPYRAPHRRQSSADRHPIVPSIGQAPEPPSTGGPTAKQPAAPSDEGASAEDEWENFVANGGLEIPLDRITDDLLKHPRRTSATQDKAPSGGQRLNSERASEQTHEQPVVSERVDDVAQCGRPPLMLDDGDTSDSGVGNADSGASSADRLAGGKQGGQARSASKKRGGADRRAGQNGVAPGVDQIAAPQPRRPSMATSERTVRNAGSSSTSPEHPPVPADPLGIRIKGSAALNGKPPANTRAPPLPLLPSGSRPTTPARPPRSDSRSSSSEGRMRQSTPSSYYRRQFEGYDENRGRHLCSVNVPYDENRFAPIHVHEKDDVVKLAAKFARTWRVYNKEQRIKQLLSKMKALSQEAAL
ncbi:hypothetical protein IW150_000008 [Coemansia sp. RSA 2607]|nr:hypothetical protein IW150_000008 [Coemansia sp. RSA 2607]